MKEIKIYTKTGDKGETGVWGGGRVPKDDFRIHAYGTVDECNAALGVARVYSIDDDIDKMLETVQNRLFIVGADLATPGAAATVIDRIGRADIALLERWIDKLEASLPKLKQFIIQGGGPAAAYLHLARTVCRRAERFTVALARQEKSAGQSLKFLNRLSDFLFVAARTVNYRAGIDDIPWDNPRLQKKKRRA